MRFPIGKPLIFLFVVFVGGTILLAGEKALTSSQPDASSQSPCGRFQIFQGRVGASVEGMVIQRDTLIRIDSVTGQTWLYAWSGGQKDAAGKNVPEGWIAVAELPRTTWAPPADL